MLTALLITGNTYPFRRELRAAGCLWNRGRGGYLCAAAGGAAAAALAADHGLLVEEIDADPAELAPLEGEALRAYRQDRKDRFAARLRSQADAADRRAESAHARVTPLERDFLRMGEPIKVGHHSERRHRRLIERANSAAIEEATERTAAATLRNRADTLETARIAGDAARQRQEERDRAASLIGKGDTIHCAMWGSGAVTKINRNSFTVWFADRGFSQTIDKSWCSLVKKGDPAKAKPEPKFSAGDLVTVSRLARKFPGVIKRRTATGYSVEFDFFGRPARETFSECSISLRTEGGTHERR